MIVAEVRMSTPGKEAAWETIQTLNRLWTADDRPEELARFFHERMIAVVPQEAAPKLGRLACVAGWSGFCRMARIHSWEESEPHIELYAQGLCAVVSYTFAIEFTIGTTRFYQKGRDLFTLVFEDGRYQVVADQYSPMP